MYKKNRYLITTLFYCLIFAFLGFAFGREVGYKQCFDNVECIIR